MAQNAYSQAPVNWSDSKSRGYPPTQRGNVVVFDINSQHWASEMPADASGRAKSTKAPSALEKGEMAPEEHDAAQDDGRKDEYMAAIVGWVNNLRSEEAIRREEFAKLRNLDRLLATRNGLVANMIAVCRSNPRQDSRFAVLALVTFFSDNNDFKCRLSIKRMSQILMRSERNVRESLLFLEENGAIAVNRIANGLQNSYSPRISAGLIDGGASVVWFADALSEKAAPRGRPAKKTQDVHDTGFSHDIPEKPRSYRDKNPGRTGTQYFTKLDRSELEIAINRVDSRYSNTREGISRPGCKRTNGNGEVL